MRSAASHDVGAGKPRWCVVEVTNVFTSASTTAFTGISQPARNPVDVTSGVQQLLDAFIASDSPCVAVASPFVMCATHIFKRKVGRLLDSSLL